MLPVCRDPRAANKALKRVHKQTPIFQAQRRYYVSYIQNRLKQREVKSVQDFIDGETLAEATHLTSGVQEK